MNKQIILTLSIILLAFSAAFAQDTPKTISGGVLNGKAIKLPKPEYPAAALAVGAKGSVTVSILIDEKGKVVSASAKSGHPLLRSAAVSAASQAEFAPTLLSGQPVKVSGVVVYVFNLDTDKVDSDDTNPSPADGKVFDEENDSAEVEDYPDAIRGGVINGKAVSLPKPEFPEAARAVGAKGSVKVQIVIDEGGNVIFAKAVSGHPLLKQSSEDAALSARFSPTKLEGQPVKVTGYIIYNFGDSAEKISEERQPNF